MAQNWWETDEVAAGAGGANAALPTGISGVGIGVAPGSNAIDPAPVAADNRPWWERDLSSDTPATADDAYMLTGGQGVRPSAIEEVVEQGWRNPLHWFSDAAGTPVDLALFGSRVGDWISRQIGLTPADGKTGSLWEHEQERRAAEGTPPPFGSEWMGQKTIEQLIGATPAPTTPEGRYTAAITRFANPLPFGLMTGPARARLPILMASGAAGGVAFQAAHDAGVPDPMAMLIALVASGGTDVAAGMATPRGGNLVTPTAGKVVRDMLEDATPAEWADARRLDAAGRDVGMPLTWAEAFGTSGPNGLLSDVWASRQGGSLLDRYMNDRAAQASDAYNAQTGQFGPQPTPREAAEAAQGAATGTIRTLNQRRTAASRPHYRAADADHVDPAAIQDIIDQLDAIQAPRATVLAQEIDRLRQGLMTGAVDPATGLPVLQTSIEALSTLYKATRDRFNPAVVDVNTMDRVTRGRLGEINDQLQALLLEHPRYRLAEDLYATNSAGIERMEQSPVGAIATAERPVGEPLIAAMTRTLTDADSIRPQDIAYTAAALRATNPRAFTMIVQTYLANQLNAALRKGGLAVPGNPRAGAMVQDALGKPGTLEAANVEQMLREMAIPAGLNGDAVVAGWQRLMEVFDRTGRIPAQGSRTNPRAQLETAVSANPVSSVVRSVSLNPFQSFARWVEQRVKAGAYREIAATLVDPNSLRAMEDLARTGYLSPASTFWLQQLVNQNTMAEQP